MQRSLAPDPTTSAAGKGANCWVAAGLDFWPTSCWALDMDQAKDADTAATAALVISTYVLARVIAGERDTVHDHPADLGVALAEAREAMFRAFRTVPPAALEVLRQRALDRLVIDTLLSDWKRDILEAEAAFYAEVREETNNSPTSPGPVVERDVEVMALRSALAGLYATVSDHQLLSGGRSAYARYCEISGDAADYHLRLTRAAHLETIKFLGQVMDWNGATARLALASQGGSNAH